MKILKNWFKQTLINACICTFEPVMRITSAGSAVINQTDRIMNVKFSHLLFRIRGVALVATEMPKFFVNLSVEGVNRPLITNVPLGTLGFQTLTNLMGGTSVNSTTDAFILVETGSIDTTQKTLKLNVYSNAALDAQAFDCEVSAIRARDDLPVLTYEYRALPASPVEYEGVSQIWDTSTAYNSTITSRLQFPDGSKIDIPHRQAFAYAQVMGKVESGTTWGLIHSDKDMSGGRNVIITASATYNALIVSYSDLN